METKKIGNYRTFVVSQHQQNYNKIVIETFKTGGKKSTSIKVNRKLQFSLGVA